MTSDRSTVEYGHSSLDAESRHGTAALRETELGPLPEEWRVVRLGEVVQLRSVTVDPREIPELPYVGLEHITPGETKLQTWGHSAQVRSAKTHFFPGDVLYGKLRPYLDKAALANFEGICSTDILVLSPNDEVIGEFLAYSLHISSFLAYAIATTTGVNHPRTSWVALSKYNIPLPPLPEQRAIAHVLRAVQQAQEATERVIQAARELKKSLMRHLFTYGPVPVGAEGAEIVGAQRAAPLQDTEIGPIPQHWQVVRLGEVGTVITGRTPSTSNPEYWGGTIPFITPVDLSGALVRFAARSITQKGLTQCRPIRRGAILVSCIGYIGKGGILEADIAATNQQINAVIPNELVENWYLGYALMYETPVLRSQARMTTVPILHKSNFERIPIPLPPLPEQQEIARILQAVDRKIEAEEARKHALEALFQSLLHHLMTAKVRAPLAWVQQFSQPMEGAI